MRNLTTSFLCSLLAALLSCPLYSAEKPTALFLAGAEPIAHLHAMGGGFSSAHFEDAFYNPWALGLVTVPGMMLTYWPGAVKDSKYNFLGVILPPTRFGVLSANYLSYDTGEELIEELDGTSRTIKLEEDKVISVGYGIPLLETVFFGIQAKQLTSTLAGEYTAKATLYDAGLQLTSLDNMHTFGVAVKDYGPKITYLEAEEPLPTRVKAGYTLNGSRWAVGASYEKMFSDAYTSVSLGTEYRPAASHVSLRGGIKSINNALKYTLGMGLNFDRMNVNLSYQIKSDKDIGDAPLILSLNWFWGSRDNDAQQSDYRERGMTERARAVRDRKFEADSDDDMPGMSPQNKDSTDWLKWYYKLKKD